MSDPRESNSTGFFTHASTTVRVIRRPIIRPAPTPTATELFYMLPDDQRPAAHLADTTALERR